MTLTSCTGIVLASGIGEAFVDGSVVAEDLCLEVGLDGLVVDVSGGEFSLEISWNITLPSGLIEAGRAGSTEIGSCPKPSAQPSVTPMPTSPCERYTVELYDNFGDG